jgi:uncharacterized protein YecT (DUF1311 family)
MRYLVGVLAGLVSIAGPLRAKDCVNATSTVELVDCLGGVYKVADGALNAAYGAAKAYKRQLDADLDPSLRGAEVALRDAQRAWIVFRDKFCESDRYNYQGGTGTSAFELGCLIGLTRTQTDLLRAQGAGE